MRFLCVGPNWFMFAGAAVTLACARWGYDAVDAEADLDGSHASGGQAGAPGAGDGPTSLSGTEDSGIGGARSGSASTGGEASGSTETSTTSSAAGTGSRGPSSTSNGGSADAEATTGMTTGQGGASATTGQGGASATTGQGGVSATTGAGGGSTTGQTPAGCTAATFMSGAYAVCDQAIIYEEAQTLCASAGMRVVRIDSAEENAWVASQVTNPWLGANSLAADDEWRWEDGELFWVGYSSGVAQNGLFTSWGALNPTSSPADADCAQLQSSSQNWVDIFCLSSKPTVCESY